MIVMELLDYIKENLNNENLTLQSEVYIRDNWGDISSIKEVKIDENNLLIADHEACWKNI